MPTPSIARDQLRLSSQQSTLKKLLAVCILVLFGPTIGHAQFSQRFAPTVPATYAAGGANPYVVALSDVNGDGKPDLIVATANSSHITISYLPGNGNGSFGSPHTAITLPATYTFPVATADFNHDGHIDLVVMAGCNNNDVCQQVIVLLGDGYGTFQAQSAISCSGCSNFQVGTADVNRDGELDLVLSAPNELIVLPGIGNGKFKPALTSTGFADTGAGLVVGDFNRDGILDVITSDGNTDCETALGNGNGTFRKGGPVNCGFTGQLTAADFRKDGKLDLIYSDYEYSIFNDDQYVPLYIARGNGDGTFATPKEITPGIFTDQVLIGDFNGDGRPDILTVNAGSPSISVLLSNSTGAFGPSLNFRTPGINSALAADVNRDGKTDVLLSLSNGVGVLLGQGGGTFHAAQSLELFSVPVAPPSAPVDVNHDGIPDILIITNENSDYRDGDFVQGVFPVLSSNGVGLSAFGNFEPDLAFHDIYSVGVGSFNRDGNLDTAIIGDYGGPPQSLAVSLNDGHGNFNPVTYNFPTTSAKFFAVGDFNGDGLSDVALLVGNAVQIELGKGGNTFSSPVGYAVRTDPVAITVRDVNGDGKQDLVVVNKGGDSVSVLLGNGNGTFQAQKVFSVGTSPVALALADFNRDGKVDIAVANQNNVSVLLGTGTGSFGTAKTFAAASGLQSIAATDLRQNGLTDLLVGASNGNLVWLSGFGNGTFAAPQTYAAQGAWFIDVADFNGDGAPDVVIPGPAGYAVSVLYNQGGTRVTLTSSATTINFGASVKFTAKVRATVSGAGTPTGSVAFYNGSTLLGTETLSGGTASLTATHLSQGTHTIKAIYSGSTNFNNNPSPTVTVKVDP